MKKTLLAAAAFLAIASGYAHADALPKQALGTWCEEDTGADRTEFRPSNRTFYKRGKCDRDTRMVVKPNSVEYIESGCTFTSIKTRFQKSENYTSRAYEVKAKCSGEGEDWNGTLYFYPFEGGLGHEGFVDNEIGFANEFDPANHVTVCQNDAKHYSQSSDGKCDGIALRFEKDRYTILNKDGENLGFCRFVSVKTEWNSNGMFSTHIEGGPVTYITAQCPKGQRVLAAEVYKGHTVYIEDKGERR